MPRVIVAARPDELRAEVAAYLVGAGFEVDACAQPPEPPPPTASLVWLTELDAAVAAIERTLTAWLRPPSGSRSTGCPASPRGQR